MDLPQPGVQTAVPPQPAPAPGGGGQFGGNMQQMIMNLLQHLGITGMDGLQFPANPPGGGMPGPGGMGGGPGGMPWWMHGGMPPGGWQPGGMNGGDDDHNGWRGGMGGPRGPRDHRPGDPMTAGGAATGAGLPPVPAPMPAPSPNNPFQLAKQQWHDARPDKPAGFDGGWGQSTQMQDWRTARPDRSAFPKPAGM